ncbi:hypothetical protein [Halalkalibacterium ligniniphilum]|uniref:hypothetical protein n=1 Tax=Halalkalibacterium ligniniphilum TaxID=1134413 RepID=UPI00034C7419|nr:hypothetical protein [Halalkalibacterium ligniniphilum]
MTKDEALEILKALREGEMQEFKVKKADFLDFREVLSKQEDMKSFRGNAQHGGEVIYTYEPGWTK